MSSEPDQARLFHDDTKHFPDVPHRPSTRRLDFTPDPHNEPIIFKEYDGLASVPLTIPAHTSRSAIDVLSGRRTSGTTVDLVQLARLLSFSGGITRVIERAGFTGYFRAASSAHTYPDLYVVCGDIDGLPAGVYYFHPLSLRLDTLRTGDFRAALASAAADDSIATRPASVVINGVPWRCAPGYRERVLRHVFWDTGGLIANLAAVADAASIDWSVRLGFVDTDVAWLLGVDGMLEFPVAIVGLGDPAGTRAAQTEVPRLEVARPPISTGEPVAFPLMVDTQRAGDLATAADVVAWRSAGASAAAATSLLGSRAPAGASDHSIEDVILDRGSTRRMLPDTVASHALDWAMSAACRPLDADFVPNGRTLLEHYVVVHAVSGYAPGLYAWHPTRQIEGGDFRAQARHVSLDQPQGGDGAYTTFHMADLDRVLGALGSRGYRAAQVEAGYVLERLHLAVFALGVGATGLTFYDDAARALFGTIAEPMTEVAVGVPAYRSLRGSLDGHPTRIPGRALDLYVERLQELHLDLDPE